MEKRDSALSSCKVTFRNYLQLRPVLWFRLFSKKCLVFLVRSVDCLKPVHHGTARPWSSWMARDVRESVCCRESMSRDSHNKPEWATGMFHKRFITRECVSLRCRRQLLYRQKSERGMQKTVRAQPGRRVNTLRSCRKEVGKPPDGSCVASPHNQGR